MFASAEAEPAQKLEQRRDARATRSPAATAPTLVKVLVVACETCASGEEQHAFTSAEAPKKVSGRASRRMCAPVFTAALMWEEVWSYSFKSAHLAQRGCCWESGR